MPPPLALLLTITFCVVMLRRFGHDPRERSGALWLPCIWIFFIASRFPGQWLDTFGIRIGGGGSPEDGSPLDAAFFLALILAGMAVLLRRSLDLPALIRANLWLFLFFLYGFLSIAWSDFPFVSFKRWVKTMGHPVMALIVVTSPDPKLALRLVMNRCLIIMLPLSVMTIKYFPEIGRGFSFWTGAANNRGIAHNKNELGYGCFIFGIFLFWSYLVARRNSDPRRRRQETWFSLGFLIIALWLLRMADSATSIVVLTLGSAVIFSLGFGFVSKRRFGTVIIASMFAAVMLEITIGIYASTIALLGRDPSLTDRTEVWADALSLADSPILGAGFEAFWLGPRLEVMWSKWWWQPNQAHSGYIEVYLNYGLVGLAIFAIMLLTTFHKISARFFTDFEFARLRMGFFFAILVYNYTEATFKAVHLVWTLFYLIALDVPNRTSLPSVGADRDRGEGDPIVIKTLDRVG